MLQIRAQSLLVSSTCGETGGGFNDITPCNSITCGIPQTLLFHQGFPIDCFGNVLHICCLLPSDVCRQYFCFVDVFQRGPTSLATSDSALSCICAFFVSFLSKLMSSTYPSSPTYFSGILLDLGVRVMKPRPSISAFLISQSMTTIKTYNTERSPSNTSVFTSNFSVIVPSIITAERVPF